MAENLMTIAYENGVNLFDTAEVYASGRSDFTFSFKHQIKSEFSSDKTFCCDAWIATSSSCLQVSLTYDMFVDLLLDLILLCSDVKLASTYHN